MNIDDFLLKYREVRNLAKPTKYRQRHVHNWMIGNRPLREEEADFINHISDLVITESYGSQGEKGSRLEAIIDEYALANPGSWIDVSLSHRHTLEVSVNLVSSASFMLRLAAMVNLTCFDTRNPGVL